ncbi:hypothetical protein CNR22_00590 [Sphingobacteriaceae bacterium]|nr:hypothetical protein CNR22_00590 [Sphingobacteriaceae bacterium]
MKENVLLKKESKSGVFFIVEDNEAYAKTLQSFIKVNFPEAKEVKTFPVGETCVLELYKKPDVVIVDYFLDGEKFNAETGIEIIRQIKEEEPDMNIILLSSNDSPAVYKAAVENYNCPFVKKDAGAFEKIYDLIAQI